MLHPLREDGIHSNSLKDTILFQWELGIAPGALEPAWDKRVAMALDLIASV